MEVRGGQHSSDERRDQDPLITSSAHPNGDHKRPQRDRDLDHTRRHDASYQWSERQRLIHGHARGEVQARFVSGDAARTECYRRCAAQHAKRHDTSQECSSSSAQQEGNRYEEGKLRLQRQRAKRQAGQERSPRLLQHVAACDADPAGPIIWP